MNICALTDARFLRQAARLAIRGHGGAEPNPLVGCIIVDRQGEVLGWGFHRQCGGPHAEIEALRRAGARARGSTLYCTLEPCNHIGRTGPCSVAIINAGISRVVMARFDPHDVARGGFQRLLDAGILVDVVEEPAACAVGDPFVHRITTGLPWVIAKWAQTIDGKIATRHGESQWISSPRSRTMVHRERGRVDAILTGIGTILHDDPLLTARARHARRTARRVVIDLHLRIPMTCRLVQTARQVPTIIACDVALANSPEAHALQSAGVELMLIGPHDNELPLERVLRGLVERHTVATVLVEAGPGLMKRLFAQRLVNEAWVFTAPMLLGDEHAPANINGFGHAPLANLPRMQLMDVRQRDDDVMVRYRMPA